MNPAKLLTLLGVVLLCSFGTTHEVTVPSEPIVPEDVQVSRIYRFDYQFSEKAGGWLKLHKIPAVWDEARLRCHAEGAVLASPLSPNFLKAIIEFVWEHKYYISSTSTVTSTYLLFSGVHATFSKGDYTSVEGTPLARLSVSWAEGEPDNLNNSESCLVFDAANAGVMADKRCTDVFPYVCYKNETEIHIYNECGTSDPEYKLERSTGSCYKLHRTKTNWARAFQVCTGEGAYLAIVNSNTEARILDDLSRGESAFIGFQDWNSYGRDWMTIHGDFPGLLSEAGFANWGPGEPNNQTYADIGDMGEYCGGIKSGSYNDVPCNKPAIFICELTPGSVLYPNYHDSE